MEETHIVMAKHNSFWVTSGPRLCMHVRRGKESGEKRKETMARKGTGRKRNGRKRRKNEKNEKNVSISSAGTSYNNSQCR